MKVETMNTLVVPKFMYFEFICVDPCNRLLNVGLVHSMLWTLGMCDSIQCMVAVLSLIRNVPFHYNSLLDQILLLSFSLISMYVGVLH